uniref:Lambda 2 mRNA capping protein n=1 Tax=Mammalian orthoreovirus TaxID=351073 RepID=A0A8A1FRI4_9REOV|nr:lambda 2 mRNA capping protein [Mammalian orthoreovirus]
MANVWGVRLADSLSSPTIESRDRPYTLHDFCSELDAVKGREPWRVLRNQRTNDVVAVQLYRPLQGLVLDTHLYGFPGSFDAWEVFMKEKLRVLKYEVLRVYPISNYNSERVNVFVANAIVGAFLSNQAFYDLLPLLIIADTMINDLLGAGVGLSPFFQAHGDVLEVAAGRKYLQMTSYSNDDDDPPLFAKDLSDYAKAFYSEAYETLDRFFWTHDSSSGVLVHYDKPTNGLHYLLGTLTQMVSAPPYIINATDAMLLESCLEQFRANITARPAQPVTRLDQCYHLRWGAQYVGEDSLTYRLSVLSLLATNGYQLARPIPKQLTNRWVSSFVSQIMADGVNETPLWPQERYVQLAYDSPSVVDGATQYGYTRKAQLRLGMRVSAVQSLSDALTPVQWIPQYTIDQASVDEGDMMSARLTQLPLRPEYGHIWVGDALSYYVDYNKSHRVVLSTELPQLPDTYFDGDEQYGRSLFSLARKIGDRSLVKDTAVLKHAYQAIDPNTGREYLRAGQSVAYFGASAGHTGSEQPLVIEPWMQGKISGVMPPSSIRQFGYDVARGAIVDLTRAFSSGDYQFVYSDVDQVVDGYDDLSISSGLVEKLLLSCMQATSPGGSFVIKINFPTRSVWKFMEKRILPNITSYMLIKPFVTNNVELFFVAFGVHQQSSLTWTSGVYFFLVDHFYRYDTLSTVSRQLPSYGYVDDGSSVTGLEIISIDNPGFSNMTQMARLAISGLCANAGNARKTIAIYESHGARVLTVTSRRSPASARRKSRMRYLPLIDPRSLEVQARTILPTTPVLFENANGASPHVCLTMMYNFEVSSAVYDGDAVLDLGTGPEAKILELIPPNSPVTCVDVRPTAQPSGCWNVRTTFLELDYLSDGWITGVRGDIVTCMLSLGAAAAGRSLTFDAAFQQFVRVLSHSAANVVLVQVNCPTDVIRSVKGYLEIDVTNKRYKFPKFGRDEPYSDMDTLERICRAVWPNCSITWVPLSYDLRWVRLALLESTTLNSSAIRTAELMYKYMPIMRIDIHGLPMTKQGNFIVGQNCSLIIPGFNAQDIFNCYFNSALAFTTEDTTAAMIPNVDAQFDSTKSEWTIGMVFSDAGIYTMQAVVGQSSTPVSLGSFVVDSPDVDITDAWPAQLDFTIAGTDVDITVNPYYRLMAFVKIDGEWQIANPDKFQFFSSPTGTLVMNVKLDIADNYLLYYIRDVQSREVGFYIEHPLQLLNTITLPTNEDLFLSAPDMREWAVKESGNTVCILNSQGFVLPQDWDVLTDTISWSPSIPTYIVPPGDYTLTPL